MQWGVKNEEEAIKAFTLKTGLEVKETGIWFHSSGILGASPDGIIDEESVLEVKCPYTEWNLTIAEAVGSATFCLEKCESGHGYALKKDHVYCIRSRENCTSHRGISANLWYGLLRI